MIIGNLRGAKFHDLYIQASEGNVMPLVNYCVTGNCSRERIISYVQGVTYCRITSKSYTQHHVEGFRQLEESPQNIQQAVSDSLAGLDAWGLMEGKQKTTNERKNNNVH